jgi:hypothetical protein
MAWQGIVGKSFTAAGFEKYVSSLKFGAWRPRFVVVHNTSTPDTQIWNGWQTRTPPITDEKWARNLEAYYKGLGWRGSRSNSMRLLGLRSRASASATMNVLSV